MGETMNRDRLETLASLIRERNEVSARIAEIINRPAQIGHVGEFIAAEVFNIAFEQSATNKGFDGRFRSGPLAGKTVDVKWYAKREGILDLRVEDLPDFYLVLTGAVSVPTSSRGDSRPWLIEAVYLFEARPLIDRLIAAGRVKIGVATSVATKEWDSAEVFPRSSAPMLQLENDQRAALALFSGQRH